MVDKKLISCPYCESVNEIANENSNLHCRSCKSKIVSQKKATLSVSWALLVTSMILYIIANVYPILEFTKFGSVSKSTIIGGVIALWEEGSEPIAVIIFLFSVFTPLLKFILVIYILTNYKRQFGGSKIKDQAKLHHFTEFIGPWSMVDIFVVAILVGVLHMNSVKVSAGVGATAFVLMVIFTMLSTMSIDTRLLKERKNGS